MKDATVILASNTMHYLYDDLSKAFPNCQWLHIADCLRAHCRERGIGSIGLLGTRFTMSLDFYRNRLDGIEVLVPEKIKTIDDIIQDELVFGKVLPESRKRCMRVVESLRQRGAEAIALACTELPLLMTEQGSIPLLDSAWIHCLHTLDQLV
jgi:aspartate racemase